jgi:putative FmdB family regulatory protein
MPTYDYRCNGCGHEFELFQQMRDKPKKKCPACAKNTLERLIGLGAGVIFKGSGFYETDYRSQSYKKGAEAEKKTSTGDSAGGSCACGKKSAGECASDKKPAKAAD